MTITPGEQASVELENDQPIAFVTPNGETIQVSLSNNLPVGNSVLTVSLSAPPAASQMEFASSILTISLYDEFGTEITQFSDSVELCFTSSGNTKDKCLNFYDESKREWICSDPCLVSKQNLVWFDFFYLIFIYFILIIKIN